MPPSPNCSPTASAAPRHRTSPAGPASRARRSIATGRCPGRLRRARHAGGSLGAAAGFDDPDDLDALVALLVGTADALRRMPLLDRIRHDGSRLFGRYILTRLGHEPAGDARSPGRQLERGQERGFVRGGDPAALAAMVLLIAQSAVQSAPLVAEWLPRRPMVRRADARLWPATSGFHDDAAHRGRTPFSSALDADRRAPRTRRLGDDPVIDVLVIGGGITGAGLALDAASRGLRTVLVERHDLAHGTSRWSSKLVHGGLRYLASGSSASPTRAPPSGTCC